MPPLPTSLEIISLVNLPERIGGATGINSGCKDLEFVGAIASPIEFVLAT